jgi:O-antigen/teichoic acid export membrane protein
MIGAGIILFGHLPVDLADIVAMCAACLFVSNVLASFVLWRHSRHRVFGPPMEFSAFSKGAFTLMIMFFGGFVTQQIDLWALSQFHPHAQAALYGAASRLALLAGLPKLIIEGSIPPLVASLVLRSDREGLRSLVQASATISGIPAFLYFLVAVLAGPLVLRVVYGAPYSAAWSILAVLSAGQLFFTLVGSPTIVLVMAHRQWDVLAILVLAGIASLVMTWLASRFGSPVDVAIASALGMVVQSVALVVAVRVRLGIFTNVTPAGFRSLRSMIGLFSLGT